MIEGLQHLHYYDIWIKSVLWEYSCNEEYLDESNKGKISKYSYDLGVLSETLNVGKNELWISFVSKILKFTIKEKCPLLTIR